MTIQIIAVGKPAESFITPALEHYLVRLQRYAQVQWRFVPHSGQADSQQARKQETAAILRHLKPGDTVILLDERGHAWDSPAFAARLEHWQAHARGGLVFVIGGAYGVDQSLQQRAQAIWSLSPLVFPHQLVRLLLIEQLYRAFSILHNTAYHHD